MFRKGGWVSWRTASTFVAAVLATLTGALLVLLRGPVRADSAVTDQVVRWWATVWLRAAGARVVVDGLERVEPAASYVVVSNHQSGLDPMADLRALPLSLRVLAMRELFRIPLPRSRCTRRHTAGRGWAGQWWLRAPPGAMTPGATSRLVAASYRHTPPARARQS
jgi:hypothetical protein